MELKERIGYTFEAIQMLKENLFLLEENHGKEVMGILFKIFQIEHMIKNLSEEK